SALRVARGYTGRQKFIKFAGNYHGHADPFLVKAGSGVLSLAIPGSPGVPEGTTQSTLIAEYNNLENVRDLFNEYGSELAAVILEPVAGNMGCIVPEQGFLEGLRQLCDDNGTVLIFDEVMTGFRLARGGASEMFDITPDLVTYGKVIGGGMPIAAFAGKREVMETVAPLGPVYQAGTLSGNPVAVACGLATLKHLDDSSDIYERLEKTTKEIKDILLERFADHKVAVNTIGSMISIHFGIDKASHYDDVANADNEVFKRLFHHCLKNGIYLPPSPFETWFISQAIGNNELEKMREVFKSFEL
ncbi:MAG: glutamate-1-semialdehyde 2,1-aminomutase, partial [Saprospiraceae bacterium]|nr:glutamate-1-semialdehyde 2,1-aminomutase [Saprospiraceae bacterium]